MMTNIKHCIYNRCHDTEMEENGVTDRQTEVKDSVIHSPRLFGE